MQLKIEGQKRDPKIGKTYIILIYQRIREGVQFPLSPLVEIQTVLKPTKFNNLVGFFF